MSIPRVVIDSAIRVTPKLRAMPIELVPVAGRDICCESLQGAQALLTRTVTRVDEPLLADSDIQFVGTASAGTDHVDLNYLAARDIRFASAAGSNASAVSDYVLAAIAACGRLEAIVSGADIGLVGYGHVGRNLARRLAKLGARVKVYDPYEAMADTDMEFVALDDVLTCHVVSLHAALHSTPPHPSRHMVGLQQVRVVSDDALFINAGRGALVTSEAVHSLLDRGVDVVLDTWPEEPHVSLELLNGVRYGTPHIAGYSQLSKNNATDFLIPSLVDAFQLEFSEKVVELPPEIGDLSTSGCADIVSLSRLLRAVGRIEQDDREFRRIWTRGDSPGLFESQRRDYAMRQQLEGLVISTDQTPSSRLANWLATLGVVIAR